MADGRTWQREQVIITVRASPTPSSDHIETSCVAGVRLRDMQPIRIFPVFARPEDSQQRLKKYRIVDAAFRRSRDPRSESYLIDHDTIRRVRDVDTRPKRSWGHRNELVEPFRCAGSIEELRRRQQTDGLWNSPSLALIRPAEILDFTIEPHEQSDWTSSQLAKLERQDLFSRSQRSILEFIPFRFRYRFRCDDTKCRGHCYSVFDWEVSESYRRWRPQYGENRWRWAMRNKYWDELVLKRDLQFYVGTLAARPEVWTIIGLYYPPEG